MRAVHVAYAVSRKNGVSFRARAYVGTGPRDIDTRTVAIEETAAEAIAVAVRYIREIYEREGLQAPPLVIQHGRLLGAIVDAYAF